MPVTKEQAQMLANLAVACRPTGAPRWDAAGVLAAIGKVKDVSLADVILAVIRAADDRDARTPGVITAPGSIHWQERGTRTKQVEPYDRGGTCSTCTLPHEKCRRIWSDDHPYISVHEYEKTINRDPERIKRIVEAAKSEVTPTRESASPKAAEVAELDHDTCEQLIAAAIRTGQNGRVEYLSTRCDRAHGDLAPEARNHRVAELRAVVAQEAS